MHKLQAVYVEWEDSCSDVGWRGPDKDFTSLIRSVGLLLERTEKTVTLSTSLSEGGRCLDQVCIPRSVIRKMRKVKL